jgi:L-gulono-1,4-lactone dehydrogenase
MPLPQYLDELKVMLQTPNANSSANLVNMLRAEPELGRQAHPVLVQDPLFAPAYRVHQPGADYEYHNVRMPMPRAIRSPRNLDTLLRTVEEGAAQFRTLKAMGDGWGFANAAFTPDWLVHCIGLDDVLPLEDDTFLPSAPPTETLVRFQSGVTFAQLSAHLAKTNRAVLQQPGFGELTFVGCASAGGHGSGLSLQGISSQLEAVELVTLNEQNQARLVRVERTQGLSDPAKWRARYPAPTFELVQDDGLFHAVRCAQGNLGAVYAVTARTQPAYFLEETRFLSTWSEAWPGVQQLLVDPRIHSVHVWINPYFTRNPTDPTVLVTKLARTTATQRSGSRGAGVLFGGMNPITELLRLYVSLNPAAVPLLLDDALKLCVAANVVMPSHEALDFGAPNTVPVHASSLGFDASTADQTLKELLKELHAWSAQNHWVSSPIGMRWVKGSQDFLSPQYGRDTIMLEVPIMKGTPHAVETLDRYAKYMMDRWGGRPHWGQQNPMNREQFQKVYGKAVPAFLSAYRVLNPNGFFDGPLSRQLGLRELSEFR